MSVKFVNSLSTAQFKKRIVSSSIMSYLSLNVTKRPFGHMGNKVGNCTKAGKLCQIHFQNNTVFVCFKHWITILNDFLISKLFIF